MIIFNGKNSSPQKFPFKSPIINYILKNVPATTCLKLYQTSKYFYKALRLNIICDFEIKNSFYYWNFPVFNNNNLIMTEDNFRLKKLKNLWIYNSFKWVGKCSIISQIISNISICEIKSLKLGCQISWNDFMIFTNSGEIVELSIQSVIHESGEIAPLEDVLIAVPKATKIMITNTLITPKTSSILSSLNRKDKLQKFEINYAKKLEFLDPELFAKFLYKNHFHQISYINNWCTGNASEGGREQLRLIEIEFNEKLYDEMTKLENAAVKILENEN